MATPKYHGDLSRFDAPVYKAYNGGNLAVTLLLLLFLGFTGAHRFHLGMMVSGFIQLCIFGIGVLFGLFAFNFAIFLGAIGILSLWLLYDIVLVIVMLS